MIDSWSIPVHFINAWQKVIRLVFFLGLLNSLLVAQTYNPDWESLDSRPMPAWYTGAKFGIFIHWGVYSVPSFAAVDIPKEPHYAEWYWNSLTRGQEESDPNSKATWQFHKRVYGRDFSYFEFAPRFQAELFDPDRWASTFKQSGAKYVVLTSKHHDGFALWPSKEASRDWRRPWTSVETGPHRDLVGDLTKSVRAQGLRMGLYYSLYEWYNPVWLYDKPRFIKEHMFPQFKDVVSRYQPAIIFSDGEWELTSAEWHSPELLAWLFNESSVKANVVINDRWGSDTRHKHGGYYTTEYTPGMSDSSHPWEESRGMAYSYGYNRAERIEHYHTARELILTLVDIVSRGGNLLLDVGPAADGSLPPVMEERLLQMGSWLAINGEAIYETKQATISKQWSAGTQPKLDYDKEFMVPYDVAKLSDPSTSGQASIEAFFTAKGNVTYAILTQWPGDTFYLKDLGELHLKSIELVGASQLCRFKNSTRGVMVSLPKLSPRLMGQPAWVLKLTPVK